MPRRPPTHYRGYLEFFKPQSAAADLRVHTTALLAARPYLHRLILPHNLTLYPAAYIRALTKSTPSQDMGSFVATRRFRAGKMPEWAGTFATTPEAHELIDHSEARLERLITDGLEAEGGNLSATGIMRIFDKVGPGAANNWITESRKEDQSPTLSNIPEDCIGELALRGLFHWERPESPPPE
jgi:hypothetical protein